MVWSPSVISGLVMDVALAINKPKAGTGVTDGVFIGVWSDIVVHTVDDFPHHGFRMLTVAVVRVQFKAEVVPAIVLFRHNKGSFAITRGPIPFQSNFHINLLSRLSHNCNTILLSFFVTNTRWGLFHVTALPLPPPEVGPSQTPPQIAKEGSNFH
jgi:hypothetical protein